MKMIRTSALAMCLATLAGTAAQAEVVDQTDTMFVSRHTTEVKAAPPQVWLALLAPNEWWSDSHTWTADAANLRIEAQAGGCFCEIVPESDEPGASALVGSVQHMEVIQSQPRQVLRMRGGLGPLQSEPATGVLTITIQETEEGSRVVWEYVVGGPMRFEIPVIAKAVDGVIGEQASRLAASLGGGLVDEDEDTDAGEADAGEGDAASAEEGEADGDPGGATEQATEPDADATSADEAEGEKGDSESSPSDAFEEAFGGSDDGEEG